MCDRKLCGRMNYDYDLREQCIKQISHFGLRIQAPVSNVMVCRKDKSIQLGIRMSYGLQLF